MRSLRIGGFRGERLRRRPQPTVAGALLALRTALDCGSPAPRLVVVPACTSLLLRTATIAGMSGQRASDSCVTRGECPSPTALVAALVDAGRRPCRRRRRRRGRARRSSRSRRAERCRQPRPRAGRLPRERLRRVSRASGLRARGASVGPQLTPELLRSSARSAGKPLGPFVAESILVPNAFTSPGYVSGLMRPFADLLRQQLDDLVSFLIGTSYTSPSSGAIKLPARPVAACKANSACRATVARWAKAERLPSAVLDGARITAVVGCLSCHRYAGSGTKSGSAPELTRIGLRKLSSDALVKQLRCPECTNPGSVMPSYAALGSMNLRSVAAFLRASKGVRP